MAQEKDSPGSVENQPRRANARGTPPSREGLSGLLRSFSLKQALSGHSASASPLQDNHKMGVSSTSLRGIDSNKGGSRIRKGSLGQLQDRNALVLMDNGWSGGVLD